MDVEALISKYLSVRAHIEQMEAAHKVAVKPFKAALATLATAAELYAKQTGQSALKARCGTAFPTDQLRVRCEDRDKFFDFVFASGAREFLTSHVSKDAVREYMENTNGRTPPGVGIETFIEWQFRRS